MTFLNNLDLKIIEGAIIKKKLKKLVDTLL